MKVYAIIAYDCYGDSESLVMICDSKEEADKHYPVFEAQYRKYGTWDVRLEEYTLNKEGPDYD